MLLFLRGSGWTFIDVLYHNEQQLVQSYKKKTLHTSNSRCLSVLRYENFKTILNILTLVVFSKTYEAMLFVKPWIVCYIYINNSLHLARKYARIFARGHHLFREANSFPSLEEQVMSNGGYRVYYPSNRFCNARSFENWGISSYH